MAMKQTTKTLLGAGVLVVVALVVAFAAAWAGRDEERKVEAQATHDKLFDFDKNHVLVVDLVRPGTLVQVARQTPTSPWRLTQPAQAPGDEARINALLDAFTTVKSKRDLGDDHDYKRYGLEHSRIIAKVVFDDGKEQGLEFGVENSFDHGIYVKKLGEELVRVLDTWQKNPFDKTPYDLRNKKVAELRDSAEVRKLDVTGNQSPYVLEKDGAAWKVDGVPADAETAERLATTLKNLRLTSVPAEDFSLAMPGEFQLDPPKLTVKLTALDGNETVTRTIRFSPTRPGLGQGQTIAYAKRDDEKAVYELENLVVNDLDKSPAELADRQLVHASGEAVAKLMFDGPSGKVEISRTKKAGADEFAVVSPQPGPAKKVKLAGALYALTNLRATSFEGAAPKNLAAYGLDKPMTATLLGEGDKVLARLRVGAVNKAGKQRYVLVDGVDKLALVEKATVEDLPWTAAAALEVASK
jgi:hypothetical protein